ncbi:MAG: SUMF1/EgtB/PvdO family nonheme iron enzyme, partial [Rhodospirillaceae bacterium]
WNEDCSLWLYDDEDVNEQPNQVQGHCDRRAVKGGSWFSMISRHRPAFRGRDPENLSSHIFGFRVARDLVN